ncbi:oxidoreductase, partial [Streptomyces sp. MCAF7]
MTEKKSTKGLKRLTGTLRRAAAAGLCGAALVSAVAAAPARAQQGRAEGLSGATWRLKDSGSDARFRGLAAVSRTTAWVAGSKGT